MINWMPQRGDALNYYFYIPVFSCIFFFIKKTALVPSHSICRLFFMQYRKAPEGSSRKVEAQKQFVEAMSHRMHIDHSIKLIGKLLFGIEKASEVLNTVRPAGQPLVDDWVCLKTLVKFYSSQPLLYHPLTCLFSKLCW